MEGSVVFKFTCIDDRACGIRIYKCGIRARRLIGHKYFPFMNYQMPEHVYADANPRLRRLLGFLPSGAYG